MEPGHRAEEALRSRGQVTRFRIFAVCVLLSGLAFVQDPGLLTSDTKFDLVVDPGRFLQRALHLWDPGAAFGQLQNQAYGYLWPMGPFYLVGHLLEVPGWVVQRAWLALVLCVAFVGCAKVCKALGVRSDAACILAGVAYALSPRMLTTLGPISIEAWPSALAPWVLLPLVLGSTSGSPRRAAALSALAVAMAGGVNAAATFAVLPMGVVWLLTRAPGPRRRSLMVWWPGFTLLGTLWWLVPLFVMGAYTPPFLRFIETTSVTTFPTTLFDTLRGTSDWVPYVDVGSRAGNELITQAYLPLQSALVLMVGFAGLIDRRTPHRLFLALCTVLGVLMVAAGHHGVVDGFFSGSVRALLDGSLSPLRNVHKFDPILRLPLVVGLGFVVDRILAAHSRDLGESDLVGALDRFNRASVLAMVGIAVAGAAAPALLTRIPPAAPVLKTPTYWDQTAAWLHRHDTSAGTALLVPGTPFADYVWGSPKDEPLQYLASAPWAIRNVIPLTPPGNIRMLDGLEDRLAQGHGSPGFTEYLRRAGISYLVVRNDLATSTDVPDPVLVHQTLTDSPGLVRAATFGPIVGGGAHLSKRGMRTVINGGWQARYPAVEIYRVDGTVSGAVSAERPATVAGGPEDLLDLLDLGVIGRDPVVLAADAAGYRSEGGPPGRMVLTDGLRDRERFFARVHDGYSAALTPGDVRRSGNPYPDYQIDRDHRWSTTVELDGARSISASSSGSDSDVAGGSRRGELPYAAVDGPSDTAWVSDPGKSGTAWWRIDLTHPRRFDTVRLTGGPDAQQNQTVRVRWSDGVSRSVQIGPGQTAQVTLDGRDHSWLRVEDAAPSSARSLSLGEVRMPGLQVTRRLVLPRLPTSWGDPDQIVLREDLDQRQGCVRVDGEVRCTPDEQHASEEAVGAARSFVLGRAGDYRPSLLVHPRGGPGLTQLVMKARLLDISASSTGVSDPRAAATAAIDGDPTTTWLADVSDVRPSLNLNWLGKRRIRGIAVSGSQDVAARLPTKVTLTWPGGTRQVDLGSDGRARVPAIRTDQLRITLDDAKLATSLDFEDQRSFIGMGIGELRLVGLPLLPSSNPVIPVTYRCGTGPRMDVNGTAYPTQITASPALLASGQSVTAQLCAPGDTTKRSTSIGSLPLLAGRNDLEFASSSDFDFDSVVLTRAGAQTPSYTAAAAPIVPTGAVGQRIEPRPGAGVVDVRQNVNAGWRAEQSGERLHPVTLDGWQQGWLTDAASAPIRTKFAPDRAYRVGLGVGLVTLLALLGCVVVMVRRRSVAGHEPCLERTLAPVWLFLGLVGAAGLLAGEGGILVVCVAAPTVALLEDRLEEVAPWALASVCLLSGLAYFAGPWGGSGTWAGNRAWPQLLMLLPLTGVAIAAGTGRPRFLRRIAGTSTRR